MGIKHLNLQLLPWCFHLMSNRISCLHLQPKPPVATVKLIKSDGLVKIYDRPIQVSELMVEFPKHLVCRSDSFYIGQKIPALSEDDQLQLGQNYFLLPIHFFQSVLSFVTIASFANSRSPSSSTSKESRNAFLRKAATCKPFDIQKSPSGCLRIRVSEEFIWQLLMEEGKIEEESTASSSGSAPGKVCTTPQLQKDYTQLVGSRQWKPKLETIRETDQKKRKISSFGMKRRKKSQSKGNQLMKSTQRSSSDHQHHSTYCTKPKIKIKSSRK